MRVEVNLDIEVDPDANFLECTDESTLEVLMEILKNCIYDIDDIKLKAIDLEKTY